MGSGVPFSKSYWMWAAETIVPGPVCDPQGKPGPVTTSQRQQPRGCNACLDARMPPSPYHAQWKPTKESYLQFLVESKAVYDMMEQLAQAESPICAPASRLSRQLVRVLSPDALPMDES